MRRLSLKVADRSYPVQENQNLLIRENGVLNIRPGGARELTRRVTTWIVAGHKFTLAIPLLGVYLEGLDLSLRNTVRYV